MTPQLLREIGEALHGQYWVAPLAEQLVSPITGRPVHRKTVERWRDEEYALPETLPDELAAAIDAKIAALKELKRKLRA